MPGEDEATDRGDGSTGEGTPKIASKLPETRGEAWTDSPSQPSEGAKPADTLMSDFWPPELR